MKNLIICILSILILNSCNDRNHDNNSEIISAINGFKILKEKDNIRMDEVKLEWENNKNEFNLQIIEELFKLPLGFHSGNNFIFVGRININMIYVNNKSISLEYGGGLQHYGIEYYKIKEEIKAIQEYDDNYKYYKISDLIYFYYD